jgi:hypothetical protein
MALRIIRLASHHDREDFDCRLVPKLQLGNAALEAPASRIKNHSKPELAKHGFPTGRLGTSRFLLSIRELL